MLNLPHSLKHQFGAVLAISLIMLLLLTLIGVTGIQTTGLEEKMAGNMYKQNISFQSAESALKQAENWIGSLEDKPTPIDDSGSDSCSDSGSDESGTIAVWSKKDGRDWSSETIWNKATNATGITTVDKPPKYIIEELSNDGVNNYYRITARGTDSSGQAKVILQSIYVRSF